MTIFNIIKLKLISDIQYKLVNGSTSHEGRVEVIRNNVTGTVCDDQWGNEEASVLCLSLGYR